jgi:small subunit ribosomal protein S16
MLKIRLRQMGRTNRLTYRLVVADARIPRDGKYVEMIGWYNPFNQDEDCKIYTDRLSYWLSQGAVLTEKAKVLVSKTAPEVLHSLSEKQNQKRLKLKEKRKNKTKK